MAGPRPRLLRGSLRQDQRVLSLGQGVAAVPLHHLLLQGHLPSPRSCPPWAPPPAWPSSPWPVVGTTVRACVCGRTRARFMPSSLLLECWACVRQTSMCGVMEMVSVPRLPSPHPHPPLFFCAPVSWRRRPGPVSLGVQRPAAPAGLGGRQTQPEPGPSHGPQPRWRGLSAHALPQPSCAHAQLRAQPHVHPGQGDAGVWCVCSPWVGRAGGACTRTQ